MYRIMSQFKTYIQAFSHNQHKIKQGASQKGIDEPSASNLRGVYNTGRQ
jgi:hypothetical protein